MAVCLLCVSREMSWRLVRGDRASCLRAKALADIVSKSQTKRIGGRIVVSHKSGTAYEKYFCCAKGFQQQNGLQRSKTEEFWSNEGGGATPPWVHTSERTSPGLSTPQHGPREPAGGPVLSVPWGELQPQPPSFTVAPSRTS